MVVLSREMLRESKLPAVGVKVMPLEASSIVKSSGSVILNEKELVSLVYPGFVTELT